MRDYSPHRALSGRWKQINRTTWRMGRFTCRRQSAGRLGAFAITNVIYENGVEIFRNLDMREATRHAEQIEDKATINDFHERKN